LTLSQLLDRPRAYREPARLAHDALATEVARVLEHDRARIVKNGIEHEPCSSP
jgi:hypothetical protein